MDEAVVICTSRLSSTSHKAPARNHRANGSPEIHSQRQFLCLEEGRGDVTRGKPGGGRLAWERSGYFAASGGDREASPLKKPAWALAPRRDITPTLTLTV